MIRKAYRQFISRMFRKIRKFELALGRTGYEGGNEVFQDAMEIAKKIRGIENPPAIIIHGVLPRSGTVFTGELLRLHPDVYAYPNDIWEIPFLKGNDDLLTFSNNFFNAYHQNSGKIGKGDFMPLFGASFMAYLYSFVPEGKRLLLKTPWADNLDSFFTLFPNDYLISLLRDGRDVVHSTTKTWQNRRFSSVCKEWGKNARMMLYCDEKFSNKKGYLSYKYEEVIKAPEVFAKHCCKAFDLEHLRFPYGDIEKLPVRGSSSQKLNGNVSWEPQKKDRKFTSTRHWETWSARKKKTFKKHAGETLIRCGYSNNLDW